MKTPPTMRQGRPSHRDICLLTDSKAFRQCAHPLDHRGEMHAALASIEVAKAPLISAP